MKAKYTITQKITFSAMLLVLAVFSTMVFKLVSIPGLGFVRFSLTPAIVIYASLSLGPLYGAIVGIGGDLIPALIEPISNGLGGSSINILITIVYGLLGVCPWALEKLTKHFRSGLRKPWAIYATLALILGALAAVFFGSDLLDSGLNYVAKWVLLGVFFLLDVALCVGLHFTNKYFQKRILDLTDIPSPNEIALISTICEIVLMVTLKSLAFYVYFMWMSGGSYKPLFTYLFASLLFASSPNILINTFAVSWMLIFTRRFLHNYGYPTVKEEGSVGSAADEADEKAKKDGQVAISEEDEDPEYLAAQKKAKIGWILFFSILIALMIAAIIVISVLKK
jgi:hypothetical protein